MDAKKIEKAVRLFLEGIGENPEREGLKKTPQRIAEMCQEIFAGVKVNPREIIKPLVSPEHDEIVLMKNIPFFSVCEHHLLPFIGKAHIAYLPHNSRVTGISKLARVLEILSRKPQVQERLTTEVAETIMKALDPKGVLVIIEAEHLCMTMRGVKKPGAKVVTSVVRGIFRRNPATRAEAMALINQ